MPSSSLRSRVSLKATLCASGLVLAFGAVAAPAQAAAPSMLEVPVFTLSASGSTTTTPPTTGTITPVPLPTVPVVTATTTTVPAPVVTTTPAIVGAPQVLGRNTERPESTGTPTFSNGDTPESNLASTGLNTMTLAAFGLLLIGIGLGLWWFGAELRSRALELRPSSIRSRRN